jgi:ribosomal-protein-alanine N-acetyltransferase
MPTSTPRAGLRVTIRAPARGDAPAFLAAVRASRKLHGNWVKGPATNAQFASYLKRFGGKVPTHAGFVVVRRDSGALAGVFNLSEIVRGAFQSAYLGYYGFAGSAGEGYMSEGLALVLDAAFGTHKLHRVECNVQPSNRRSIALVERTGFTREGFSRRYVKIAGRWRDHVRYAMLAEDWRKLRRRKR